MRRAVPTRTLAAWGLAAIACLAPARPARAQGLPTEPIALADGRVILSGEIVATIGPTDPGFFNYVNYEFNALRNVRVGLSVETRASEAVRVLVDVRLDQGHILEPYGLFVRVRPWHSRPIDIEAGLVPRTFGALTADGYGSKSVLIGQPLAYQYLLSIRPDALPATADDLLRMRGRGWLSSFPVGSTSLAPGLPIVNTSTPDAGVRVHGTQGIVDWTGAVTVGSLSDPRIRENNGGRQLAGRVTVRPSPAVLLGASAAQGAWLDRSVEQSLPTGSLAGHSRQTVSGADAEYAAGPVLVRGEIIRSSWTLPAIAAPAIDRPLVATSARIEGRYKLLPGLSLAVSGDRLEFSTIRTATTVAPWEAAVWRLESGASWSATRNLILKVAWQRNDRSGGRVRRESLVAAQVRYWF